MNEAIIAPISPRRRRTDRVMRGVMGASTVIALVPLVLILYYLFIKAADAWSTDFFTTDPTGNFLGNPGGIKSAILGTIVIVALATAIAVPIGVGVALYLTEYGKNSRFAAVIRYFIDVMTGVPSIVFGLFIYIVLVLANSGGSGFAGWKGSAALALLMLPVITRAAGETAPLLYTATLVNGTTFNLNGPMNSLPAQIFSDVGQAQSNLQARAWGAATTLVVMILILTTVARIVSRRSRLT